jgi:DNA-binding beta-propeller fold protein YncE
MRHALLVAAIAGLASFALLAQDSPVGPAKGGHHVATGHLIRPAGEVVSWSGRPVAAALSPDGQWLFVKDNRGLVVVDAAKWKVAQQLAFPKGKGGGSMHGLAVSRDGKRAYATTSGDSLCEAEADGGKLKWKRTIRLPGPGGKGASYPTGIALTADGKRAWVCLSRNNSIVSVDLVKGTAGDEVAVGMAPYAIALSRDAKTAYVTNWGGRRPKKDERTALSSGSPVLVDERGVASSGTVARVSLEVGKMIRQQEIGLHPAGLALSADGKRLFVACANSDTVCLLNAPSLELVQRLSVRPDKGLPFGSATNDVALSPDGKTLYAANGGNNAVAVVPLDGKALAPMRLAGFVPAGWYPGAVACGAKHLFIANVKGEGSRTRGPKATGYSVYGYTGTASRVAYPSEKELAAWTKQVREDAKVPQVLKALERGEKAALPSPVPARLGEPSVFEHVVYIIKENRTYDQVFGDIKQGNGDTKLCIFGRDVTPNHHALAEQFVLLDNFYCNGVLSADGHSWATEGNVTDHLEKAFGGFSRSYTYGDDPLTYSSSGFLWDGVLLAGLSFRNYGELVYTDPVNPKGVTFTSVWKDYQAKAGKIAWKSKCGIATLDKYTSRTFPGWNMMITDVQRVDDWLKEFRAYEKKGEWVNLTMMALPQDHCSGLQPGMPTPNAHMADNDLALGRLVEAISKSKFWKKTVIFVIEDDPQNGFDHVDGHRSLCLVISPYTKRKTKVSRFYNQTSVLHTMERILGVWAMNQMDGSSPLMTDCFTMKPDFTPYKALPAKVPLDQLNWPKKAMSERERYWARRSQEMDLSGPDRADEEVFNRILWHAVKGTDAPYPEKLAGAHGRGLGRLGLRLARRGGVERD